MTRLRLWLSWRTRCWSTQAGLHGGGVDLPPDLPALPEVVLVVGIERHGRRLHLEVPADGQAGGSEEIGMVLCAIPSPG